MTLKGFGQRWTDFPDYILGITKEIWEERQIATLHDYYAKNIPVRSPGSVVTGNQNVISATLATLAEFPDRTLLGEDVIWSESEDGHYMSSHRILSQATHAKDGVYGKATGKKLRYRVIADCAARNGVIDDEWLIRDQGAVVRLLGLDPKTYAADLIVREGGPANCVKPFTPKIDVEGPYKGRGNDNEWGQNYAQTLTRIMNGEVDCISKSYDRACHLAYPGGQSAHGHEPAESFWLGLRASFPNAAFKIEHQIGRDDPLMPPRAALRWSLYGKHEGWGSFGAPTDAEIYVFGASHAEFGPWGLRREFVLFDETAIWKQIILQTG